MPFDPSVIARIGQTSGVDQVGALGRALSMKALLGQNELQGLQLQQTRSSMERDARLRDLTTGADITTDEGQAALIENLSRGGFTQEALQLHGQLLNARKSQREIDNLDLEALGLHEDAIFNASVPLAMRAEEMLDAGTTPEQVAQQMTPIYQQFVSELAQQKLPNGQPVLGEQQMAWVQQHPTYDHDAFVSMLSSSKEARDWIKSQNEQRAVAARDAEARRAARAREGSDSARLGLERERLGLERERVADSRTQANERLALDRERAKTEAEKVAAERARLPRTPPVSAAQTAAQEKLKTVALVRAQLNRARAAFADIEGTFSAGPGGQYLPTEAGQKFDAISNGLQQTIRQLTRTPGEGAMSDYESRLAQAIIPTRGSFEGMTAAKLDELDQIISDIESGYKAMLGPAAPAGTPAPAAAGQPGRRSWNDLP